MEIPALDFRTVNFRCQFVWAVTLDDYKNIMSACYCVLGPMFSGIMFK